MIGRCTRRLAAMLATTIAFGVALAPSALAHDKLISSTPSDGERVAAMPTRVLLRFEEPPTSGYTRVRVLGPNGEQLALPIESIGSIVTVPLASAGSAGEYVVDWSVLSDDGHPVSGVIHFDLMPGAKSGASAADPTPPRRGPENLAWVAVGVAALTVLLVLAALRSARRRPLTTSAVSSRDDSRA